MSVTEEEFEANVLHLSVPEMQVFRVFQTSIDELFELAVDFWHKLGEGKLLGERKLEEIEHKTGIKYDFIQTLLHNLCTINWLHFLVSF